MTRAGVSRARLMFLVAGSVVSINGTSLPLRFFICGQGGQGGQIERLATYYAKI